MHEPLKIEIASDVSDSYYSLLYTCYYALSICNYDFLVNWYEIDAETYTSVNRLIHICDNSFTLSLKTCLLVDLL